MTLCATSPVIWVRRSRTRRRSSTSARYSAAALAWRRRLGSRIWRPAAWLLALTVVLSAIGNAWAGLYPLPDPRHGANPVGPALFALPLVVALVMWRAVNRPFHIYFAMNLMLYAVLIVAVSMNAFSPSTGWFQRLFAAIVFAPIGVAAVFALRRGQGVS
jgi:hypothetical protein